MKTLLLLLFLSVGAFAQTSPEGMTLISGFQDSNIIELDATVKYSTKENGTIIISKNKLDVYEITSDTILPAGKELRLFLKLAKCNECITIPAELIYYSVSVKQSFDDINKNRDKVKEQYPNF
jgi:hypothetical protein